MAAKHNQRFLHHLSSAKLAKMYTRYSKVKSLIYGEWARVAGYDSLPLTFMDTKKPHSYNSLAPSSRGSLVKEFLSDQVQRSRDQPPDDGQDLLLDSFAKMLIKAEQGETSNSRKSRRSISSWKDEQRYVIMSGFASDTSMADVVSRIRGGAIERLILGTEPEPYIELFFLDYRAANSFFQFARTGLFIVNGKRPLISKKPPTKIIAPVQEHVLKAANTIGASRVIILQTPSRVPKLPSWAYERFPKPSQWHVKGFDVEDIRRDMSQFGEILEIRPVVCEECAVAVHYLSLADLVLAMRSLAQYGTSYFHKYQTWTIKFGPDPANMPCYNV